MVPAPFKRIRKFTAKFLMYQSPISQLFQSIFTFYKTDGREKKLAVITVRAVRDASDLILKLFKKKSAIIPVYNNLPRADPNRISYNPAQLRFERQTFGKRRSITPNQVAYRPIPLRLDQLTDTAVV